MTVSERTSLRELAFVVCTALEDAGITAVLTGGSAATVYAPHYVQSEDLDFVLVSVAGSRKRGVTVLEALGFRESGGQYKHPASRYWLEFPEGPLGIGRKFLTAWDTLRDRGRILHILTPTDACCDRLAAYLHWGDPGSLEQAIGVALANLETVDMQEIRRWCEEEGRPDRFESFETRLETSRARPRPVQKKRV